MAISFAGMNVWPIPAIPMMALAAANGAAQIAAISAKEYATGGVLEGPSHKEGGIKVLGGRAEVEGGEYITNRETTRQNVEVLDFINSKRQKLNLSDFVEFYSSKKVASAVQSSSPLRKFADGGQLPTMSNVDITDGILQRIDRYANRPTVVSVVDIIDRSTEVNDVRVMAGLS